MLGGIAVNLKFTRSGQPMDFVEALESLIVTFVRRGGFEIQINVVDKETLLEAQRHPDRYHNLIVRVSGWSARFTTLSKILQDDITSRTAQKL